MTDDHSPTEPQLTVRAEYLKERIYVTFTSLSVILALQTHANETTAGGAATTLVIAVIGTLLAVLLADYVSHIAVHASLPTSTELRHMVRVSIGAIGVVILPLITLLLAGLDVWSVATALQLSAIALVATLALVGYLAVRRVKLSWWTRLIVLLAEVALALLVIGLELLAHG